MAVADNSVVLVVVISVGVVIFVFVSVVSDLAMPTLSFEVTSWVLLEFLRVVAVVAVLFTDEAIADFHCEFCQRLM